MTMNQAATRRSIVILLSTACATSHIPSGGPTPSAIPQPVVTVPDSGPWTFRYRSDTLRYEVSRSAAIESQSDSGTRREITTNNTHEILSVSVLGDTTRYSAVVDSFSTATQGLIGPVQQVTLPVEISGSLDSTSAIASDSTALAQSCDPVRSSLQTDAHNLLISFPAQLSPGLTWSDSTMRTACYGTIPIKASLIRKFSVVGRTSYDGRNALAIQRSDTVIAHGEGRQQQHRLIVDANGAGNAMYYVSPEESLVIHLTTDQNLEFVIQASGRTSRFRETAKQEYSLVR